MTEKLYEELEDIKEPEAKTGRRRRVVKMAEEDLLMSHLYTLFFVGGEERRGDLY